MFWLGVTQALEAQRIENLNIKKAEKMEERIFNINRLTKSEYDKCREVLKEKKMTRQEAIQKMSTIFRSDVSGSLRNIQDFVDGLEALGLLKFEETPLRKMCSFDDNNHYARIEKWPEGYCLWFNGVIVWRSWK